MDRSASISRLAHFLQVSANTARYIARDRKEDAAEIYWLAHQIEEIAERFEQVGHFGLDVLKAPEFKAKRR